MRGPDGQWYTDLVACCEAWVALAKPIADATGVEVYGYDPGVSFYDPETKQLSNLSVSLVNKINKALEKS